MKTKSRFYFYAFFRFRFPHHSCFFTGSPLFSLLNLIRDQFSRLSQHPPPISMLLSFFFFFSPFISFTHPESLRDRSSETDLSDTCHFEEHWTSSSSGPHVLNPLGLVGSGGGKEASPSHGPQGPEATWGAVGGAQGRSSPYVGPRTCGMVRPSSPDTHSWTPLGEGTLGK